MQDYSAISFAEKYNISTDEYAETVAATLPLSVRVINRFQSNNIKTIADLLNSTPKFLMSISGFGLNCLNEVDAVLAGLKKSQVNNSTVVARLNCASFIYQNRDSIVTGDFSFADVKTLKKQEIQVLQEYKEAYSCLGSELVHECYYNPQKLHPIINMLADFCEETKLYVKLWDLIDEIPCKRHNNRAISYINAFSLKEDDRKALIPFFDQEDATIRSVINYNNSSQTANFSLLEKFLKWCTFDLNEEISNLFQKIYDRPRVKTVIQMRAQKRTLEQVGNVLGVTRERVRQIEVKARKSFAYWQSRTKIISKISADRNGDSVITPEEIEEYCGKNVEELLFLLRGFKNSSYSYDSQLDVFIVGDESLPERILAYVENLPDIININNMPQLLKEGHENDDLPKEMLEKAIADTYKLTGNVYHRNRLSLAAMYTEILRKYYPDGINAYNDNAIKLFRERVQTAYGDVKLPTNNRAITSRIASICILCGRGMYKLKEKTYIPACLASKIYDYIKHSENSIFLTNTLFNVFETELVAAGIKNKYHLQGVLHELFSDEFVFRRDYISRDGTLTSIYSSVVEYIKKSRYPVNKAQIKNTFPGITDIVLNFATSDSNILNFFGEYLHASKLILSNDEKKYLHTLIHNTLKDGIAHHGCEFYDIINNERPELLTRNAILSPFSAFSFLEYLFKNEYQFSRPYVAQNGVDIGRPGERLHDLIYSSDEFAVSDISDFMKDNHFQIQSLLEFAISCNDKYLLSDNNTLVSIERSGVTEKIARIVEDIVYNEVTATIPIYELPCFGSLPPIDIPWTEWLVFSILNKWSTKLSVATSSNQLRLAVPLVSHLGQMDADSFESIKQSDVHSEIKADNLDDIDALLADIINTDILEDSI